LDVVRAGEVVHVIERRVFAEDVRRHFVGVVEARSKRTLRVKGYLFVYDSSSGSFMRKPELRARLIPLDNRVIINILSHGTAAGTISYITGADGNLQLTDGADFGLDISEFSVRE